MTAQEARAALLAGETVRLATGSRSADPVLRLWVEDRCVVSYAMHGWSAGVREPVCGVDSEFLLGYLSDRHSLEVI